MTSRSTRLGRGSATALLATAVALASHLLAGASVPGVLGIVVPLVFALAVCTVLAGVRLSAVRLSISVAASQLLFHTLFVVGTVPAGTTTVAGLGGHLGHGTHAVPGSHGAHAALVHEAAVLPSSTGAEHAAHGSAWMWLAHLCAAAVTVVALHRGEMVLERLRRLATAVLTWVLPPQPAATVLVLPSQRSLVDVPAVVVQTAATLVGSLARRGPPVRPST